MSDPHSSDDQYIELPAPTPWPLVTAFGITLIAAGFVTHWFFSAMGLLVGLFGAVYWFRDVYPHDRHEAVPLLPEPERVHHIEMTSRSVEHLEFGRLGHRVRLPLYVHPYSSGVKGGIVGGLVMAALALLYGAVAKGSIWWPVNILSATVLPGLAEGGTEALMSFSLSGLIVGAIVHGTTSILIGWLYSAALPMFPRFAWLWAGILTPLFWSALFFSVARFVSPTLAEQVSWPWFIVCQLGYGMVGGYVVARSQEIETMQTYPLAVRAGVETMHKKEEDQ